MNHSVQEVLDQVTGQHRPERPLVLLFDYDGTLAPIVEHPRLAHLDRRTRRLLARLSRQPGVHVGILSGRMLEDLKQMVCLPGLSFAGTAGLEVELDGQRITHPNALRDRPQIRRVVERLRAALADYPGAWVEDKQIALTIHYREVPPEHVEDLLGQVAETLRDWTGQLRVLEGPMAIEIMPGIGWDKGDAVRMIVRHVGRRDSLPVYLGDGANDVPAMKAVVALGGIAVGIGPRAPRVAQFRLPSPAAVTALLGGLDKWLGCRAGPPASRPLSAFGLHGLWRPFLLNHFL
jgi:trehalose 6-phosphate phosphatase